MKNILLLVLICCIPVISTGILAQNADVLSSSDSKRIAKADKKISKGDQVVEKKQKYSSQIEALESSGGSVRTGKIERLEKKANKEIIKSASFYKDGYGKKYSAYKKAVSREIKNNNLGSEAEKIKSHASKAYKNGRKWRRKSAGTADVGKAVDYLFKANGIESDAIKNLARVLETAKVEEDLVVEQIQEQVDSVVEVPDTSSVLVAPPVALVVPEDTTINTVVDSALVVQDSVVVVDSVQVVVPVIPEEAPVEEVVEKKELALYFSVQFLAEKQPVPKEKITNLYDGPHEVVKHEADGWYRYSIGKFESLEKAKQALSQSGVKGYIVAYHNEERISTRRAAELILLQ
ncbi:SPOR domain-containing protein [Labilibacter sediminis]|nr:SPOR domain-containing protein [Labilibacter sediminis]